MESTKVAKTFFDRKIVFLIFRTGHVHALHACPRAQDLLHFLPKYKYFLIVPTQILKAEFLSRTVFQVIKHPVHSLHAIYYKSPFFPEYAAPDAAVGVRNKFEETGFLQQ